ncbi:dienelactone hydrolase [Methyloprofundus sedimenti]|uniref:Dienelactone hydrolase n=1 Tax=Methyloprofundus sedimenti TaxID=1420851 RepID=A0A1V8MB62_9GAMM|nr:dienelactone hydrolase family protein [Methyloprofundus sedimenti]OQK18563.1 dienelactone hydrolase [Methyloprofundus sedimenti]
MQKWVKISIVVLGFAIYMTNTAQAEIRSQVVNYKIGGQAFQGYLSYDNAIKGKRPGVLVVHEWWGHNAYARKRADMLASLGYTAFALDMYGAGKLATHPEDAQKFMQATLADMTVAEARFNAAKQFLQQQATVEANKIVAIGYCFGGGTVLHMARVGTDLAGVVSFHGSLATKTQADKGQVKAKILVFNGADDPFVTTEQIGVFKQEMHKAGADLEFVNYPGVKHSFTNPDADGFGKRFDMPLVYNAAADKDSWARMQVFLRQVFEK